MKACLFSLLFLISWAALSQEPKTPASASSDQPILVGLKLSFGGTLTGVKDKDPSPSGGLTNGYLTNPADGYTQLEKSGGSVGIAFTVDLPVTEKFYFATGLNIYSKAFTIRNTDGAYSGVSSFGLTYLQIPLTVKRYFMQINDQLRLYGKLGPTIDFKIKEKLKGDYDGSHYWNLAKNLYNNDPTRGRNGDNKSMALFNPLNFGLLLSVGGEYKLTDQIILTAAINYNPSFANTINPSLKLNDINKTPVGDGVKIRTSVVTVEIGVAVPF
jgi:hypothetical protein